MKKIGIGIIGCGKIAQLRHIPEYAANEHVLLKGFFDVNLSRAEELAFKYGGKAYNSYEALLADPEIEAVSVLTPNFTHAEISIAALKAGKHVLCEKPMAVSLADCEAMVETAKQTGNKLMIGQNQRLTPAHRKARELIQSGAIGDVITFHTTFSHSGADNWSIDGKNSWFMDKNQSHFGAMADLGVHKTDLIVYLLGKKIKKTSAVLGALQKKYPDGSPITVDDNAFCTFIMENGVIGTMSASWTNYGREDNSTSIYGTLGAMHIYKDPHHSIVIEHGPSGKEVYDTDVIQTNDNQTSSGVIDLFIRCLLDNTDPDISAQSVLAAMRALFACEKSAQNDSVLIDVEI